MKAAVLKNKTLELKDISPPILKKSGAIVKIYGCGLCGSDIVKLKQNLVADGAVLGHEIVGEIIEINTEKTAFKLGDKIVSGHHVPCFACVYCQSGNYSMCRKFKETNILPGGFSEYIFLSEDHLLHSAFKLSGTISYEEASFTEPLACCLRAVKRAGVSPNKTVLVMGLGSIGLLIGQAAKVYGATVFGCDLFDERVNLSETLGFDQSFKYEEDFADKIKENNDNLGVDIVFLASGSNKSLSPALKSIRDGGTICVFSSVSSYADGFANNEIYYRELTVMGSYSPSTQDLKESLKLIEMGKVKVDTLISNYPLGQINEAIEDTLNNRILKAYIKL
ncbi:MAG: zinc-binding dehydrogenase [bacterium]